MHKHIRVVTQPDGLQPIPNVISSPVADSFREALGRREERGRHLGSVVMVRGAGVVQRHQGCRRATAERGRSLEKSRVRAGARERHLQIHPFGARIPNKWGVDTLGLRLTGLRPRQAPTPAPARMPNLNASQNADVLRSLAAARWGVEWTLGLRTTYLS